MPDRQPSPRWSRESRLLLLTIAVCAGVLLVLARLRFPDAPPVEVSAPPLERLAARASYDELAADVKRAEQTIARGIVTLRVARRERTAPYDLREVLEGTEGEGTVQHVVAMRTSADTVLAPLGAQSRLQAIRGDESNAAPAVLGMDRLRGWALVRVPAADEPVPQIRSIASLTTPTYVLVAEGTQAGATLRPVFLGQSARFDSPKWNRPLLPLGGIAISPGALLFTLDGEFIGAAVVEGGAPAIVGAQDLFDAAARMGAGTDGGVGDLGVSVQRLTADLALATGVDRGVVIAEVDPDGPAASVLEAGDVLTMLDGEPVADPGGFLLHVAGRRPGETLDVSFVRAGESATLPMTLRALSGDPASTTSEAVSFVREPGAGTRVEPGGGERVPGLQPGDIVARAAATVAPTPAQLRALLSQPSPSGLLMLVVRRDGRQQIVAVRVAAGSDAGAR